MNCANEPTLNVPHEMFPRLTGETIKKQKKDNKSSFSQLLEPRVTRSMTQTQKLWWLVLVSSRTHQKIQAATERSKLIGTDQIHFILTKSQQVGIKTILDCNQLSSREDQDLVEFYLKKIHEFITSKIEDLKIVEDQEISKIFKQVIQLIKCQGYQREEPFKLFKSLVSLPIRRSNSTDRLLLGLLK